MRTIIQYFDAVKLCIAALSGHVLSCGGVVEFEKRKLEYGGLVLGCEASAGSDVNVFRCDVSVFRFFEDGGFDDSLAFHLAVLVHVVLQLRWKRLAEFVLVVRRVVELPVPSRETSLVTNLVTGHTLVTS